MRRFVAIFVALMLGIAFTTASAHAATTVVKTYRTYNSYTYTITVDAGSVTAGPTQGNPITTGGCVLDKVRKPNGQWLIKGAICPTPGTVKFTSPDFPVCETPFTIQIDGAVVYTDVLNAPCPPPPPPAVIVTVTAMTVTFTNPATVAQSTVYEVGVVSLDAVLTADAPFSYTTATRYAGIGLNRYAYFVAVISVTLTAGQTITVTR